MPRKNPGREKNKPRNKKPGRPKKPEGLKSQILLAATQLIAQRGFDGFTLRDVADSVGVHTALVGYYFGAKVNLERAVLEAQFKQGEQALGNLHAVEILSPEEALRALFKAKVAMMTADSTSFRFILWILARGGDYADMMTTRLRSPVSRILTEKIQEALPEITLLECEMRAAMFFSLIEGCSRLYWGYSEYLPLKSGKNAFLDRYYRSIEERFLPQLLLEV